MLAFALPFFILTLSLCSLSIPLPKISQASASVSPEATIGPAPLSPTPLQLDVTSPLKFGDLNAPSEGGVFNDFAASPGEKAPTPPSKRHIFTARLDNSQDEEFKSKRSFLHLHLNAFAEKDKKGGGKQGKGANAAGGKAAGGAGNPGKQGKGANAAGGKAAGGAGNPGKQAQGNASKSKSKSGKQN